MSSSRMDNLHHLNSQAKTLSHNHQRVLVLLNSSINTHIQQTVQTMNKQVALQTKGNREQVKQMVTELQKTLQKKFSESLLAIFSSLNENLRDNDLKAFNCESWITKNMNIVEQHFGSNYIPSHEVLNIINDLTSTWTEKVEKLQTQAGAKTSQIGSPFSEINQTGEEPNWGSHSSPGKDFEEINDAKSAKSGIVPSELKSENRTKSDTGANAQGGNFFSRVKGIFKTNADPNEPKATKVNLGNSSNFKYDPVLKRYVFDGEEIEPEEEDNGPPPIKTAQSVPAEKTEEKKEEPKKEVNNMLAPASNRTLMMRKKGKGKDPVEAAEQKKPAFMPAVFVPSKVVEEVKEEEKVYSEESVLKQIEELFEKSELGNQNALDQELLKEILEDVESIVSKEMKQKFEKEMEVVVLQKELEASAESLMKEVAMRRNMESEIALLRAQYEQTLEREQDLRSKLEDTEKELDLSREIGTNRSEILGLLNESDYQEKLTEVHFKSLQETNEHKKKAMEARNQIRDLEMKVCEVELESKAWEERYKELARQNEENSKLPKKLRTLLEEYMQTQNEQDGVIIKLKEENCEVLKQYRKAFEELGRMAEENWKTGEEVRIRKEEIGGLQRQIKNKEKELSEKDQKIKAFEKEVQERGAKISELDGKISQMLSEKRNLESLRESENDSHERKADELHARMNEIIHEKDDIVMEKEKIERERDRLIQQRDKVTQEKEALEVEKKVLEDAKENLEQQNMDLLRDKNELTQEKEAVIVEKDAVVREKESLEKFREELTHQNLSLEARLQEMDRDVKGLKSEKQQWSQGLFEFVKELETGDESSLKGVREYMEHAMQECSEEEIVLRLMGVLKKVKECVDRERQAAEKRNRLATENFQTRFESLEQERVLVQGERDQIREEAERLRVSVEESQTRIQELVGLEETVRNEKETLRGNFEELERQFTEAKEQLEAAQRSVVELQEKEAAFNQESEEARNSLQLRTQEFEEEKISLQEQIEKLQGENVELQQQLDEGFTQYGFIQEKLKEALEQVNALSQEKEFIANEFENSRANLNNEQNQLLNEEIDTLNYRIRILSDELQAKDTEIAELSAKLAAGGQTSAAAPLEDMIKRDQARLDFLQLEKELRNELDQARKANELLEESKETLAQKIRSLESDKFTLEEELRKSKKDQGNDDDEDENGGVQGDKLCASIERIYGDSAIYGLLGEFIEQTKAESDVTVFKVCLDLLGALDEVFDKLKRENNEHLMRIESLTRLIDNAQIEKQERSMSEASPGIRAEDQAKIEELQKEVEAKKGEIQELLNEIVKLREEFGEDEAQTQDPAAQNKGEPTVKELKKEVKKEQEKWKKLNVETESYKKMIKNIEEERGAIQKSYAQIIRNLSSEIDELKKKKGIPVANTTVKAVQTEEINQGEETSKGGFLSGLAKLI